MASVRPSTLARFSSDRRGNVAIIFATCLTGFMLVVALGLDHARSYNAKAHLQNALDASALAGAKYLQDSSETDDGTKKNGAEQAAQAMFDTYMNDLRLKGLTVSNFKAQVDLTKNTVTATADAKTNAVFSGVVRADGNLGNAKSTLDVKPTSTVSYNNDKIELILVLDITGSMNQKPAAASDPTPKLALLKSATNDVIDALMADSPNEKAVRIGVAPFSASVNAGSLANVVSNSTTTTTCGWQWAGFFYRYECTSTTTTDDSCVIERDANYEDQAPNGSARLPVVNPASPPPRYSCPNGSPVIPLQGKSQVQNLKNTIAGYTANGATAGHIGAAWGWYLLSDKWASYFPAESQPAAPSEKGVHKHVIFMTDGQFNTSYLSGATDDTTMTNESYSEFQKLCSSMKDKNNGNITIWTIGFDIGGLGPRAGDELAACSGSDRFFDAATGPDLKAAFGQIVKNMRGMRVAS